MCFEVGCIKNNLQDLCISTQMLTHTKSAVRACLPVDVRRQTDAGSHQLHATSALCCPCSFLLRGSFSFSFFFPWLHKNLLVLRWMITRTVKLCPLLGPLNQPVKTRGTYILLFVCFVCLAVNLNHTIK